MLIRWKPRPHPKICLETPMFTVLNWKILQHWTLNLSQYYPLTVPSPHRVCVLWNSSWCRRCAQAKVANLWYTCSQDFFRVTVYLVVQIDFSRWKMVHFEWLTLSLDSRLLTTAIKGEQITPYVTKQNNIRNDCKMYRIELKECRVKPSTLNFLVLNF